MQLQANDISRHVKAKFVIWPHFFKHYAKIFLIAVENEGIAFDHMEVTLNDFNDAFNVRTAQGDVQWPRRADEAESPREQPASGAENRNQASERNQNSKIENSEAPKRIKVGLKWKSLFFSQLSA